MSDEHIGNFPTNAAAGRRGSRVVCALWVAGALVVAFQVFSDSLLGARAIALVTTLTGCGAPAWLQPEREEDLLSRRGISEEARFLIYGKRSDQTRAQRAKSIWDSNPDDNVFFGHYVTALVSGSSSGTAKLEALLRQGQEREPDNARYDYLLASVGLDKACDVDYDDDDPLGLTLVVYDRAALDAVMPTVLEAGKKPVIRTHAADMLRRQLAALPPMEHLEEHIARVGIAAGVLLPDISRYRKLSRICSLYGRLLVSEGKTAQAMPFLESWYPLGTKIAADSFILIEMLVAFAIIDTGDKLAVKVLESAGEIERAREARRRSQALYRPRAAWKERMENSRWEDHELIEKHAGMLQGLLLPAIGEPVTDDLLKPGRTVEQVMFERTGLTLFTALFLLLMLGAFLVSLRGRRSREAASVPRLLVPDAVTMAKLLLLAVVVPVGVYFVYSRYAGFSGRIYSVKYAWPRFAGELLILQATILHLSVALTARWIRKRCGELGIGAPLEGSRAPYLLLWLGVVLLGLTAGAAWVVGTGGSDMGLPVHIVLVAIAVVAAAITVTVPVLVMVPMLWPCPEHRQYTGTLARSLVPVFAAVVVLVGLTARAYLNRSESRNLQADAMVVKDSPQVGFTAVEMRLVERLRTEFLEAARELEKSGSSATP